MRSKNIVSKDIQRRVGVLIDIQRRVGVLIDSVKLYGEYKTKVRITYGDLRDIYGSGSALTYTNLWAEYEDFIIKQAANVKRD